MRRFLVSFFEVIEVAAIALIAVVVVRTFLVQPFLVSGSSMAPNFENGDYLLIDELSYRFRSPERGEVLVFHYPNDETKYFIKRAIGLPGDRVEIKDGKITVYNTVYPDGTSLEETYLPKNTITATQSSGKEEFLVPEGKYLVLGDNRSHSYDSREWGLLGKQEIVGVVRLRLWPVDGLRVFAAPRYQN